jgi:hypothetical protein
MTLVHRIARTWALALDADDFAGAAVLMSPACTYVLRKQTLRGVDDILASYRAATDSAHAAFDEVTYDSKVREVSDLSATIRYTDCLRKGSHRLEHVCDQKVYIDGEGRVVRIVHVDLDGESERLRAFLELTGVDL